MLEPIFVYNQKYIPCRANLNAFWTKKGRRRLIEEISVRKSKIKTY